MQESKQAHTHTHTHTHIHILTHTHINAHTLTTAETLAEGVGCLAFRGMGGGDSQGPPSAAKGMAACEDPDATAPGELVGEVDPTGTVTGMTCNSQSENMPGMAIYTTTNQKLWQE